ncbi:esterase AAEL000016 [Wyeomyia smithii]|uniref:esterase AAEL000016 n=1 Tax=Wyeomyia smithii TaxID=174621 RepID=UPI0024681AE4|nr:esterase AAEL000016 [Wyeomyia smithii]XP_055538567.1 esterase AAEL000016 [Wyeomyia smithii]
MANDNEAQSPPGNGAPAASDTCSKLKILALHGYRQNGDSLKSKLGSFRKFISKYAELVFVTAPHIAPPLPDSDPGTESDPAQRSWWFNKDDGTFKGTNKNGPAVGFEESLKLVEKTWKAEQCCGLLGFSQGACFAGLLCDLSARGMTCIKPEFAVLSSGFRSGSLVHLNYYENKVQIPSLHIFGESDEIIPKGLSIALAETFVDPQILVHPGGHFLPAQAAQKQTYVDFFRERLQYHLEAKEIENATVENSMLLEENGPETVVNDDNDSD